MITGKNYIGFSKSVESDTTVTSVNAFNGTVLEDNFFTATSDEIDKSVAKAKNAFIIYSKFSGAKKADFLDEIAKELESLGDELVQRASIESGLPEGRFVGERGRTTGQLRLFASLLRDGNWVESVIDTALPDREPIPRPDIRKMLIPIGPVVVFTASNFPLAFSTAGGDTASALASGCPVIVKAHESHLGVNDLVAGAIIRAAQKTGMPDGVFSSLNGDGYSTGQNLVLHPGVKAVTFTGSFAGGKAIYDLAQNREEPIPVFAEMGSVNPVVLLEEKLEKEAEEIATLYAGSITLGVGQFCTNPGLLFGVKSKSLDEFSAKLAEKMDEVSPSSMLNEKIAKNYSTQRNELISDNEILLSTKESSSVGVPTLAKTSGKKFLENRKLHQEIFGPLSLLVECEDTSELEEVLSKLEGQLTGTIIGTDNDLIQHQKVIELLESKVGRLIFNAAPTGVEVSHAMNHGGPFPSTTDSRYTSVGTGAIKRFARPICYQGMPDSLLPDELKNSNPMNIMRMINGGFTKSSIE